MPYSPCPPPASGGCLEWNERQRRPGQSFLHPHPTTAISLLCPRPRTFLASPARLPVLFIVIAHPVSVSSSCTHCPLICTSYNVQRSNASTTQTMPSPPGTRCRNRYTLHRVPMRHSACLCLTHGIFFFIIIRTKRRHLSTSHNTASPKRVMLMLRHGPTTARMATTIRCTPALSISPRPLLQLEVCLCQIFLLFYFYPSYGFLVVVSRSRLLYLPMILSYKSAVEVVFLSLSLDALWHYERRRDV